MEDSKVASLSIKLASYYKRMGVALLIALISGFFFILGFLIDFAVDNNNYVDIFGFYSSCIFSPVLVISGILFIVFFIQISLHLRKIGEIEESAKFYSDFSSSFQIIGLVLLINSVFFAYLRIQDNVFLLSRIIAMIGLVCITTGFFYQKKQFNVLYNLKYLSEKTKKLKKLIIFSFVILIILLLESVLRHLFKYFFYEYYCSYSKCFKRLGNEYFSKINYLNFFSLILIAFFVSLIILQIFKTSKSLSNFSKSFEDKYSQLSKVTINIKINKLSKILSTLISISVPNMAMFFLILRYGYDIEILLGSESYIVLLIQFCCWGIIFSITSIIIFILYIINLNKLYNFNKDLKKKLKIASINSILGTVFLVPGIVFAKIYYKIDYWFYFSRVFLGLCLIMFLVGSYYLNRAFNELYNKRFLKSKSLGSRLYFISTLCFFVIFMIESALRITAYFIYRRWICTGSYCRWQYDKYIGSLNLIVNWLNLGLILCVFVFIIAGIRLIGKDSLKITKPKKLLLISDVKKPLIEKIFTSVKILTNIILFTLLSTLLVYLKDFIEWDNFSDELIFNESIWIFFGIFTGLTVTFFIIFLIQNYNLLMQKEKTKKGSKIFLYTFSGFILVVTIAIIVYAFSLGIYYTANFVSARILFLIALVLLTCGYSRLEKGLKNRDKKGLLFASSLSFLIAYIFDFIVRFVYIGIYAEERYGRIRIDRAYYDDTTWLFFINIALFSSLIIFHIISLYWFYKKQFLLHQKEFISKEKQILPVTKKEERTELAGKEIVYCTNCGKIIDDISDFCVYCGIKIKKEK